MWPNLLFSAGLITFIEQILNSKLQCSGRYWVWAFQYSSFLLGKNPKLLKLKTKLIWYHMFLCLYLFCLRNYNLVNCNCNLAQQKLHLKAWKNFICLSCKISNQAGIYLINVNNTNTRTRSKICSKLIIKTPDWCHYRRSGVSIANFKNISHLVLMFLLLTLSR